MTALDEIKKAAEGDGKSIEQICTATWEPLYRFIYFKVQNREEAEDITQETYVKTLSYLQKHAVPGENLPGFLKTMALNVLRDRWRQRKRRGIPADFEKINLEDPAGRDYQRDISRRLEIENALTKLSEDQRTVLDLRIIKGYSAAETAKIMEKTETAVRTAQHRALQALARILDGSVDKGAE